MVETTSLARSLHPWAVEHGRLSGLESAKWQGSKRGLSKVTIYSPERDSRAQSDYSLRVSIFDGTREFAAGVVDLSNSGARLLTDAPLERGLQILLRLYVTEQAAPLCVSVETRWRRQLARGAEFELGVRFIFEDESQRLRVADFVDRLTRSTNSHVSASDTQGDEPDRLSDDDRRENPRVQIPR